MKKQHRILFLITSIFVVVLSCNYKNNSLDFQEPNKKQKGFLTLNSRACYFADADSIEKQTHIKIDTPSCREIEQIASIMEYAGLPQNFTIYRGNIDNALATVVNNQRLIIYNKDLFAAMDAMSSSYWTSLFIIAHEIGHHLANNISETNNLLNAELEADRFAGFILYKMGADSNQVIDAVSSNLISTLKNSKTHPSKQNRIEAVKNSWLESYNLHYLSAIPPAINDHFSQALNKTFDNDITRNNLNGFPAAYNPRGYNDFQLINNSWGLSLMDSAQASAYSHSRSSRSNIDSLIYGFFPGISRNYQGIIMDVKRKRAKEAFSKFVFLEISILITKTDPNYNYAGLLTNQRYKFLVCFLPTLPPQDDLSYYNFFAGGRQMEFDIMDLKHATETFGLLNISRAYSL